MFCQKCGNKLAPESKFCSGCGMSVSNDSQPTKSLDLNTPVLIAKPVFIPWVAVASVIPIQLFMTVWAGGFFGGFSMFGLQAIGIHPPMGSTFIFFGALAFFGIPGVVYYAKKNTYAKTQYKFYPDRLEYAEGFWTAENKTIKYKNVTEVNLRQGVIQKKYGLGTIILSTPATGLQQGASRSGIRVLDIEDTETIYKNVKELIG